MKVEQECTEGMVLDPDVPVVGDEVDIPSEQTESDVVQPLSFSELLRMPVKSGLLVVSPQWAELLIWLSVCALVRTVV